MYTKQLEEKKKMIRLSKRQREIIVGTLLGDGHLETQNHGRTYRLKIEHGMAQYAYVEWLMHELGALVGGEVVSRTRTVTLPRGEKKTSKSCGFHTYALGILRFYGKQFYVDGKKRIPNNIAHMCSAMMLAVWFMDDGSLKSAQHRTYIFHTAGYSKQDLTRLVSAIKRSLGITMHLHRQQHGTWRVYVVSDSAEKFRSIVSPYIHPSLMYKLGNKMPKK